ncbi:YdeI/OmpD-associated family protein [Streptomyces sp. WAC 00631]|uniref:YdeI/OmpD-associated family protein n=1 Tax=Streptomyces sp. WAC 00631 TaxID=2203201 RepID=UPI001E486197|nr:YdeI/OmpD-associated family protein [Streptomyces sp. WAC 00631]MCC5032499.1 YdeI/OmpD-associated family protein [Streptomyces sp. WAC 00631]
MARLEAAGLMLPAGRAAVDAAKADGRWTAAYAPSSEAEVPADLRAAIAADPAAQAMFEVLTKTHRFALSSRVNAAKRAETRTRRSPSAWRCWSGTRRSTRSEPGRRTRRRRDRASAGTDKPTLLSGTVLETLSRPLQEA